MTITKSEREFLFWMIGISFGMPMIGIPIRDFLVNTYSLSPIVQIIIGLIVLGGLTYFLRIK